MKIKKTFLILSIILYLINFNFLHSQEIDTDRPDQTDSPETLTKRKLQVETGFSFEKNNFKGSDENFSSRTFTSLIRYGLFKRIELRVNVNYNNTEYDYGKLLFVAEKPQSTFEGFVPIIVGTKIKIIDGKNILPASALSFNISIPKFASEDFKTKSSDLELKLLFENVLSNSLSLGYNLGVSKEGDTKNVTGLYSMSLGISLSERLSSFIEFYGFAFEKAIPIQYLNAGFSFLFMKNFQADISAGYGSNKKIKDFFLSGGLSVRLPK